MIVNEDFFAQPSSSVPAWAFLLVVGFIGILVSAAFLGDKMNRNTILATISAGSFAVTGIVGVLIGSNDFGQGMAQKDVLEQSFNVQFIEGFKPITLGDGETDVVYLNGEEEIVRGKITVETHALDKPDAMVVELVGEP